MKKLCSFSQLNSFKESYEGVSNLEVPISYLKDQKVFGFYKEGELVAGFILGNKKPYRTLQTFVEPERIAELNSLLGRKDCVEVCCFWMKRAVRKNKLFNLKVWLKMAWKVHLRKETYVIYGTNSKGLAKMYGCPKQSLLIHQGTVKNSKTYVFITRRKGFFIGALKIVQMKIQSRVIDPCIENNSTIKNKIFHELSA